jgi:hypothetical protein
MFTKIIKLAITCLLLSISITVSDSCKKKEDQLVEELKDINIFDTAAQTAWNYWVVGKGGENYYIKLDNSKPSIICYKPTIASSGYPIFLDDKGIPVKAVIEGYIFLFGNYRQKLMDVAAILPNGEISVFRDISIDFDFTSGFTKSDQGISSNSDLIRWTGRAIGVAACGIGLVAAIPTGGISLTLSAIGCGATLVGIASEILPEKLKLITGLSSTTVGFVSTAVGCLSSVSDLGLSCILGIASKEAAIAAVAVEDLENRKSQISEASVQLNTGLKVTTNSITSVTPNSATGGGNVTNSGSYIVTARGVCWSTSQSPTVALMTKTANGTGIGSFTSNLAGLTYNTTYYVRAYATNNSGTVYGSQLSFKTLEATLPSISTNSVNYITQTSASCGGDVTSSGGSEVTTRGVCWSTTQNPTTSNSKTSNGTGSGSFMSNITELTANTTYHVRAYAINDKGTAYGNDLTFTTLTSTGTIPTNGLVAYYPFNGNANDHSGNNNNGTVHGATLTADRHGVSNRAYLFDGIDNYIEISHSSSMNLSQQISISFWAKFETSADYYWPYHIIEKYGCWGIGQREFDIVGGISTSIGDFNFFLLNFEVERFYHIVMAYNGSLLKSYVNGVLSESTSASGLIITNLNNIYIGKYTLGDGYFFDGTLDDIRIYNRALTDQEISALYNE